MSSVPFDPYHKWLGIPQRDQPPNHYRLLGIPLYEDDVQVVESAADRQMAFLRKFQTGEHSADGLKLLNEVSRARICLLKSEAKAAYDESLRAVLNQPVTATPSSVTLASTGIILPVWATPAVLGGAGAAIAILVIGIVFWSLPSSTPKPAGHDVAAPAALESAPETPMKPGDQAPTTVAQASTVVTKPEAVKKGQPDDNAPKLTMVSPDTGPQPAETSGKTKTLSKNQPAAGTGTPTKPQAPATKIVPGTVNLLARINVDQHRIAGQWTSGNQQLESSSEGPTRLGVPYIVPDEYDLTLKVERTTGKRGFGLVFPVQGHPAQLLVDVQGATQTRLAKGGSGNSSDEPVFEGQVLEMERPVELLLQVRRGRIAVAANGKEILKWKGDAASFVTSLNETFSNPRERELMLVSLGSSFRVSKLELTPPQKTAPSAADDNAVNLLSLINPQRDAPAGNWAFKDGVLVGASPGPSQAILIEVPYEPTVAEYDLIISATREGVGAWTVGLQVQGSPCVFLMNTLENMELYGLSDVDGKPGAQNETTKYMAGLPKGTPFEIRCRVRQKSVAADANGETVVDWKGDVSRLTMPQDIKPPNPKTLSLLVQGGTVRFNSLTFISVTDPSTTPKNTLTADSGKSSGMSSDSSLDIQKLPTPDAAAQESARKQVRDSLKVEYALAKKADGKNHEAKINLSKTLMSRVESSDSNPAESYVMLSDAAEFAAESGQLSRAWEILNELGDRFDLPSLPLVERAAKAAGKFAKTDEDIAYLASMYVLLLDEAVRLDDFETAAKAAPAASGATRKHPILKEQLAAHSRRIIGLREAFELAKPAREVLKVNPNDPTANLAWGRYVCFYKGDWLTGLPLLAQSSDAALVSLAKREVEQPRDLQPLMQLGDDWWSVAEEEKEPVKSTIRERAADAWQLALPLATGLQKKELESKVERIFKPTKFFETTVSGQGISVANPDLNPGPLFTVEFWVATQSKSGILISKREDRRDSAIVLGMDRGRPAFRVGKSTSESQTGRDSRQAINDGRWHHIAIVKLGSRLGLFVDGKWTAQTEYAETYLSGSPWKLGHDGQSKQPEPAAKFCRLRFSKDARYLLSFHPEKNYARDKATIFIP